MTWTLWAHSCGGKFWHCGSRQWVELHGLAHPVVEVNLTEDRDGEYWGWLPADKDTPCFIWPSYAQVDICFPYGVRVEEDAGRGRVVRLRIERTER